MKNNKRLKEVHLVLLFILACFIAKLYDNKLIVISYPVK
jgi:hypothetical protein